MKPACRRCKAPVDRLQQSKGVICAYPCNCWHSPADARALAAEARTLREAT